LSISCSISSIAKNFQDLNCLNFFKISNENQKILNENCDKNERINALEAIIDKDSLKLLHLLFGELNTCTSDLDSLVTVCSDLHKGNDISVTKLLGTTTTSIF
jgi:hypothetical protein